MEEIHKLRAQISHIVQANFPGVDTGYVSNLRPPSALQVYLCSLTVASSRSDIILQLKVIKQLLTAGFIDRVAVRKDRLIQTSTTGVQFATSKGVAYKALGIEEDVFIHPSSILANTPPPEYVIFHELVRTSRIWLKGMNLWLVLWCPHILQDLTVVNPAWLSTLGKPSLCTFSKPAKIMGGTMMKIPKFGPDGWELPAVKVQE
jgi:ATP-dependent RNA helicase DHX37/DHR1